MTLQTGTERELMFLEQMAPSQEEVEVLCRKLAKRITALIEEKGHDEAPLEDSLDVALGQALEAPLPQQAAWMEESDEPPPHRCAQVDGFSLQANVALAADDREGLLRLVRYGARQSFSQEHLSLLDDGRIRYALKRPFGKGGARAIVLEPTALLQRLAALVPRPYLHLRKGKGPGERFLRFQVFVSGGREPESLCGWPENRRTPCETSETSPPSPSCLRAGTGPGADRPEGRGSPPMFAGFFHEFPHLRVADGHRASPLQCPVNLPGYLVKHTPQRGDF
jgi:hypothetical protein